MSRSSMARKLSSTTWMLSPITIPISTVDHTVEYCQVETSERKRLDRSVWVRAALEAIADGGLGAVAVVPLAERLGVTKGSFYLHFPSREALVEAALAGWEESHTAVVIAEIEAASTDPPEQPRPLINPVTALAAG